jgi:hypothetical protein
VYEKKKYRYPFSYSAVARWLKVCITATRGTKVPHKIQRYSSIHALKRVAILFIDYQILSCPSLPIDKIRKSEIYLLVNKNQSPQAASKA